MAQLTDDCFAFGGRLLPLDEAVQRIAGLHACVAGSESLALADAAGRILARDVVAGTAVPPRPNSAVDGYAVHFADLDPNAPTRLPIAARIAAGQPAETPIPRGQAARVFTGALMPPGPDTVMMQEDCEASAAGVLIRPGIRQGANRRDAGEDIAAGERALAAGTRLSPADLALLAAIGCREVAVRSRLRVAVFSTGDEVAEPGAALRPGQIYDANRIMLATLLRGRGAAVTDGGILPDRPDAIRAALAAAAAAHDLVLTSGGVSTGEEDHVRDAIAALGQIGFWRVGIKPGRPVALGDIAGTPVLGLPGNPVAALVTFALIARPLLDALAGATPAALPRFPVAMGFAWRKKADRREFLRVTLAPRDFTLQASLYPKEGAGIITSLTQSDALLELPEHTTRFAPGDPALAIPLALLWDS
jgi:molybdopterin molybdotransferase